MYDLALVLTYGITFGIVLMTIVYTFIRYVYSKEIFYISYCLMQIASLLYIVAYSSLFDISFFVQELALVIASLSALVFAVNFYEGKFIPKITNYKELILNTFLLNVVILTAFYHYMLFEYLPYTIIYAVLFISVIFNLKQGFKPTLVYVLGWSVFCLILFIWDFKGFYTTNGYMDLVIVAFAIEAVLFTMSVAYRYNSLKQQSKNYEEMLFQQSKLAKTGQMLQNITHQFRQPLNNISYILMNLKKRYENNRLDEEFFYKKTQQANEQLQYLSKTIEDFRQFYTPSKEKKNFLVKEAIQKAVTIIEPDLKKHNIQLNFNINTNENIEVHGILNELSQVILSLLTNSKDELINIEKPIINLDLDSSSAEVVIKIADNAGGIKNINKIFEPYYTTKNEGLGIGLYLVKQIIEDSFEGKIEVVNQKEGALFTLLLEKAN
ncbi:ATP-binding protein [Arcobacter sp. YIC-464]|uniref:ATP-binding protein n=1 Tax=Arcobacter sp. YIC-464 TaxID=3376631 RepID=UPI003C1FD59C